MKYAQILESVQLFGHCPYFPVNIYSCKQRNRCNQTVPTKISQDYPRPMLWDSLDLTKKSAATRSLNNIIPVLYSLGLFDPMSKRMHLIFLLFTYTYRDLSATCCLPGQSWICQIFFSTKKWWSGIWSEYYLWQCFATHFHCLQQSFKEFFGNRPDFIGSRTDKNRHDYSGWKS